MSNVFGMMKRAAQMQLKMRKIQKELARHTVEAKSGEVTVVAGGDMTVRSVKFPASSYDPSRPERLEKMIVAATNSALEQAKKKAADEMAKSSGGLSGLAEMLGG